MPYFTYASNVSPQDRFSQLEISLDNGRKTVIEMGKSYNLTVNEVTRARRYVVMVPTDTGSLPLGVAYLPVKGLLEEDEVPVWSEVEAAFLPERFSSPSLRFEQPNAALSTSRPHHVSGAATYNRARVTIDVAAVGTVNLVDVKVNNVTVATLALTTGQTSGVSAVAIGATDGDAITVTRLSTQGGGIVVELDSV